MFLEIKLLVLRASNVYGGIKQMSNYVGQEEPKFSTCLKKRYICKTEEIKIL